MNDIELEQAILEMLKKENPIYIRDFSELLIHGNIEKRNKPASKEVYDLMIRTFHVAKESSKIELEYVDREGRNRLKKVR